jgi:2-amino-4-hydroxy-6-hydroxymethyldihydropteridine diphosphokinase
MNSGHVSKSKKPFVIKECRCYDKCLSTMKYFLGLGSNLGDKRRNLSQALEMLARKGIKILKASSLYQTEPVDFRDQPCFYNQVVEVRTSLEPPKMLRLIKGIEKKLGRGPGRARRPRPIDIDILLAENRVIRTRRLTIPHPRLEKRNFVLVPFKEISPGSVHPLLKKSILELWKKSSDSSSVRKLRALRMEGPRALTQRTTKDISGSRRKIGARRQKEGQ